VRGEREDCLPQVRGYGFSMNAAELFDRAKAAAAKAYAPYSHFHVGCALLTAQGNIFSGCNVENASYGLTICAERNAIFHAVTEEGPGMKIATLAVIALGHEFPPCGACRQVIAEFASPETAVWFLRDGKPVSMTMAELLPASFRI
jgi:cytidine deaminase